MKTLIKGSTKNTGLFEFNNSIRENSKLTVELFVGMITLQFFYINRSNNHIDHKVVFTEKNDVIGFLSANDEYKEARQFIQKIL